MSFNFATAHYSLLTPEQVAALSIEEMTDLYNDAAKAVVYLREELDYLKDEYDWMETENESLETELEACMDTVRAKERDEAEWLAAVSEILDEYPVLKGKEEETRGAVYEMISALIRAGLPVPQDIAEQYIYVDGSDVS